MSAKKILLNMLMVLLTVGLLAGCLDKNKPNEEEITSDISSYLSKMGDDTITRSFDNLEEVERSKNKLLYTFDVTEAREIDDEPAYFSPDYKLKQKYYAQYLKRDSYWDFSVFEVNNSSPVFEELEEPNMESLIYDSNFSQYGVNEIINSNLYMENGRASYTLSINFDGKYFSKVTEVSFDLKVTRTNKDLSWTIDNKPVSKDFSIDTSKILGKWTMKTSNGNNINIDIIDISNGKATVQFNSTQWADPLTLIDSTSVEWVGDVDENEMNIYRSKEISLVFPVEIYADYIYFNKEKFYKR